MSNTEAHQWDTEADDSLARNEILTNDEIIRTVTAEDGDDDNVNPLNPKFLILKLWRHSTLHYSGQKNLKALDIMFLRRLRGNAFELKIGTAEQKRSH
ncbi:hypothetical protein AVEN_31135-1 [Araneus ventricosus]|uniref:Uncharacterized protein n=1 Tax=Araneus ventricosus TaxID=182803 RepID=A0A4Y2IFD8_ARAVE|nr:hypothetical protein AVEN_31135-1 [Araneus ventricosus]